MSIYGMVGSGIFLLGVYIVYKKMTRKLTPCEIRAMQKKHDDL
jgi:hypothetical protein